MANLPTPSDQEIHAAYLQGEEAVIALFQRWSKQMAARGQSAPEEIASLPYQEQKSGMALPLNPPTIHQGDIYWISLKGSGGPHPYVVIQEDIINASRISSVVVCAITSNPKRASFPGNLPLDAGEANLPRQSVVEVSKVSVIEKAQLGEPIGSLNAERVSQILAGMRLVQSLSR